MIVAACNQDIITNGATHCCLANPLKSKCFSIVSQHIHSIKQPYFQTVTTLPVVNIEILTTASDFFIRVSTLLIIWRIDVTIL